MELQPSNKYNKVMNSKHLRKLIFDYFHHVGSYEQKKNMYIVNKLRCIRCESLELTFFHDSRRQCYLVHCNDCDKRWIN